MRIASRVRGVIIGALIASYAWLMHQPQSSFAAGLIIAAVLQLGTIIVGRIVPLDRQPQVLYICELIADGATVFLFALGIYGGIVRTPADL